jgi:hypothetical protein
MSIVNTKNKGIIVLLKTIYLKVMINFVNIAENLTFTIQLTNF